MAQTTVAGQRTTANLNQQRRKVDMKIGRNKLKMSSGEIRSFGSEEKRDNFEKVARAYKHGWKGPSGTKRPKKGKVDLAPKIP